MHDSTLNDNMGSSLQWFILLVRGVDVESMAPSDIS